MIKTSKSCDLNFANSGRDTEAKTSPRHLNFLKQLNKTTEMLYPYISGFKIHQGTQLVPRNTAELRIIFWFEEYFTHWNGWWGVKYDKKINEEYFSYNNMKALFT